MEVATEVVIMLVNRGSTFEEVLDYLGDTQIAARYGEPAALT